MGGRHETKRKAKQRERGKQKTKHQSIRCASGVRGVTKYDLLQDTKTKTVSGLVECRKNCPERKKLNMFQVGGWGSAPYDLRKRKRFWNRHLEKLKY